MPVCLVTSLALDEDAIVYGGPGGAHWRLPLAALQVIGEFTTAGLDEDRFLAFVADVDGGWFQAPCSAAGLDAVLPELRRRLGGPLPSVLTDRATAGSRVLWPQELVGQQLFELPADDPSARPGMSRRQQLHPRIQDYVAMRAGARCARTRRAAVDLQPTLAGASLTLRPLAAADFDALYAVAADPLIWEQHPEPTRYQRPVFEGFFAGALASGGALAVLRRDSGAIIGTSRYYDWNAARREVAIGFTFLARQYWGGAVNGEVKRLMLQHAFGWADTVWFHVGRNNWRSRKALEKIGARYSHEVDRVVGDAVQPYVHYRASADDWPERARKG